MRAAARAAKEAGYPIGGRGGVGLDARRAFSVDLHVTIGTEAKGRWLPMAPAAESTGGVEGWWLDLDVGAARSFGERLTLNVPLGVAVALARFQDNGTVRLRPSLRQGDLRLGSVVGRAGRMPLVSIHASRRVTFDTCGQLAVPTRTTPQAVGGEAL